MLLVCSRARTIDSSPPQKSARRSASVGASSLSCSDLVPWRPPTSDRAL